MNTIRPVAGLPNLSWLRAFEAAARTSSFAAAAKELRLTSGAISYQIRALEANLGFPLFERLARGVKLTPMGVAYLPPVRKAFEELADSTVGLFGGSERVQISVHAPVSLAALWLAPRLPRFTALNPGIEVRLTSVIWDNPVPDEATDLEIRYGRGHWHGYGAEHLVNQSLIAVASPSLRQADGASGAQWPAIPAALIHIMGFENHWLMVRQALGLPPATGGGHKVDTILAALELASTGAGCALTHPLFVGAYVAAGRLVIVMERDFPDDNSYFVVMPERPQRPRREARLFRDWLMSEIAAAPAAPRR